MTEESITPESATQPIHSIRDRSEAPNAPSDASRVFDSFAFVLTPTKLNRIIEVCKNAFKNHPDTADTPAQIEITANMKKGREVRISTINDLLGLDNTRSGGIRGLTLKLAAQLPNDADTALASFGPAIEIFLHADEADPLYLRLYPSQSARVRARSDSPNWNQRTVGEIEEQIERLRQTGIANLTAKVSESGNHLIWPFSAAVIISIVLVTSLALKKSTTGTTAAEFAEIQRRASEASTPDEKVDFLLQMELAARSKEVPQPMDFSWAASPAFYVVAGSMLAIVAAIIYLVRHCYPLAVFDWGDMAEEYRHMTERRKMIWSMIIGACGLGILAGMLSNVASSFLGL